MPDPWETLGTQRTADDIYPESFDTSTKTSHMWAQAAVFTALVSGGVPKTAFCTLWSAIKGAGWVVARARVPLLASSTAVTLPLGTPFSCSGVTGLMFAIEFSGISGTIEDPALLWRTFDSGDPKRPNAWSSLSTLADVSSYALRNSGDLAVTTTGKIMAQPGFRYSTSGTNPSGVADILVAAKMT